MRRLSIALCMLVLLVSCRGASAGDPPLSELQAWVGKEPFQKIGDYTFWTHPIFVAKAYNLLGPESFALVTTVYAEGVSTPVDRHDDILSTFVCKPHECLSDSAAVLIDIKKDKLYVCLHDSFRPEDMWYESGKEPKGIGESGWAARDPYEFYDKYIKDGK